MWSETTIAIYVMSVVHVCTVVELFLSDDVLIWPTGAQILKLLNIEMFSSNMAAVKPEVTGLQC